MAFLIVREPGRVSLTIPIDGERTVGRDPDNDIVLEDRQVSRRHARLSVEGDRALALDLGSTHGTYVNGSRAAEARLRAGDQLQLGGVSITFQAGEPAAAEILRSTVVTAPPPPGGDARRLSLLLAVSRAVGSNADPARLLPTLLDTTLAVMEAARGELVLHEGRRRVSRGRDVGLPRKVVDSIVHRSETVLVRDGSQSGMGAPLRVAGRTLGALFVARDRPFGQDDLDYFDALVHLLAAALWQAAERQRLAALASAARDATPVDILGESEPVRRMRERIARFAASRDAPVLVRGESGAGKELVARALHEQSSRADGPFVAVNCAALPEALVESELFGHERGAFTGAEQARRGRFALAHGGTLFLDEVGELSAAAQAKLLRALEEGEVTPVGAEQPVEVDVRVVSATNRPLQDEMAAGRFRADLYYRLGVAEIEVPPLRDRGEDVVLLARIFLERAARRLGKPTAGLAPGALEVLRAYDWPGNVRQLANEIERALLLADGGEVDLTDLRARLAARRSAPGTVADAERSLIERTLREHSGNIQASARALGISRNTLYRRIGKLGITVP